MTRYFTSDQHFGHYSARFDRGIITFERTQFKTIQEHDEFMAQKFIQWSEKLQPQDELWVLGDWGDIHWLYLISQFKCRTHFVFGNHDCRADKELFEAAFDEVHDYPVYLSDKLVVSHEPVGTWDSCVNIHGHLHGSVLNKPNYLNASVHVANYNLVSEKNLSKIYAAIPKYCNRFLYEPWAADYKFTQPKKDVIMDKHNIIDLSASRVLQRIVK